MGAESEVNKIKSISALERYGKGTPDGVPFLCLSGPGQTFREAQKVVCTYAQYSADFFQVSGRYFVLPGLISAVLLLRNIQGGCYLGLGHVQV